MIILTNFFSKKKRTNTAEFAKERLQIIISQRKSSKINHLPKFKNDLIKAIKKYVLKPQILSMQLQQKDKDTSILKLDILFLTKKNENNP